VASENEGSGLEIRGALTTTNQAIKQPNKQPNKETNNETNNSYPFGYQKRLKNGRFKKSNMKFGTLTRSLIDVFEIF